MKSVKLFVPATIGNVGPGFDVLGLAFEGLGNTYRLSLCEGKSRVDSVEGIDFDRVPTDPRKNLSLLAADYVAKHYRKSYHFALEIEEGLPIGGGLGSSAAACLAGAYGAMLLLGEEVSEKLLFKIGLKLEGHLDNIAPAYCGGLAIAVEGKALRVLSEFSPWIALVTPKVRVQTKKARALLPENLPQAEWTRQMALSCALVCSWQQNDVDGIRLALQDPYAESRRSKLIPGFDQIKQSALNTGALGCSISGAGPTIFALFEKQQDAEQFAGNHQGHVGQVAKEGIRVC